MSLVVNLENAPYWDWRIAENHYTCLTPEQADVIRDLENTRDLESIGAADVRFGAETGDVCAFFASDPDHYAVIAEDGSLTMWECV